ncbi:CLUMA_CG017391, isoform A [Clunio marinus]|uniref:CLUMA_CG017391, isoform A n=1 Tax=Clunio marinus TaxID=568069 RepID=A0A1J1IVQ8_9DIPT|nr:CLUMA_CG017391, isoform A [Clunio marinus]
MNGKQNLRLKALLLAIEGKKRIKANIKKKKNKRSLSFQPVPLCLKFEIIFITVENAFQFWCNVTTPPFLCLVVGGSYNEKLHIAREMKLDNTSSMLIKHFLASRFALCLKHTIDMTNS